MSIPVTDALKLSKILATPGVEILCSDDEGFYLLKHMNKRWVVCLQNTKWQELDANGEAVGELHYGSLSTFYKKCIECSSELPVNFGKMWNKGEVEMLFIRMSEEKTVANIADLLDRSPYGILLRVGLLLGLDFDQGRYDDGDFDTSLAELVRRQVAYQVACLNDDE